MQSCIKCAAPLPEGALYCPLCGKKQTAQPSKKTRRTRPNGSGSVYRRGSTWSCSYVHGYIIQDDGKKKAIRSYKGGFKTKKEAMEYVPTLMSTQPRKVPSLQDLWQSYKSSKRYTKLTQSRQEKYPIAWNKIKPLWFRKIDQLTTFDLQNMVDSAAETYYPARDIRDLFSQLYQTAMPDKFVTANLAMFIELPPVNAKKQQPFEEAEVQALWKDYSAGNWWTGYLLLMIYTGMMPGELLAARKDEIDWEEKQIVGAGLKTSVRKETPIVLADMILPVVRSLCDHTEGDKLIRINKDNFYGVYYGTLERAGCRRLHPYSCRHTTGTALAKANVAPSVIQRVMRHARFSTTEKYIHMQDDDARSAVNLFAAKTTTDSTL